MKKEMKKLSLNRETLRSLNGDHLKNAAGGFGRCGTEDCSASCFETNCGQTGCICPYTMSVPPAVPC